MITVVTGIFAAVASLVNGGISLAVVYSALSLVFARAASVYSSMKEQKAQMVQARAAVVVG